MTGPEHYLEAERLLTQAKAEDQRLTGQAMSPEVAAQTHLTLNRMVADAQVHATLALAAATAGLDAIEGPGGGSATGRGNADWNGWIDAGAVTPD